MRWLIYKHTTPSGKVYIGQTRLSAEQRWRNNGTGYTYNCKTRFSMAIKKYGWENINHEILEDNIVSQEKANIRERYWISYYNSYDYAHGYNMTIGGDSISFEAVEKAKKSIHAKTKEKIDFIFCYELLRLFPNATIAFEWFLNNGYATNMKRIQQ